jgi:hypothetical protein
MLELFLGFSWLRILRIRACCHSICVNCLRYFFLLVLEYLDFGVRCSSSPFPTYGYIEYVEELKVKLTGSVEYESVVPY